MHGRDPASVYRQRWRWNAVQTAHQGYPLIGISTSSTILSPARYRPGSIKSPIPWRASRWLRLQGRPRAHQSEPAPSRVDIGFLACIVIVHPSNQRATTAATSTTEGARTENVSAAKVSEGADTGRGDTLKENLRKDIEAWYRDAGKYTESLINVVHLPRTVPLLLAERRDIYLNETFARDPLGPFDLSAMWIFLLFSFFSFFFLDRDLWRLLTFFRWNIFKKYLSLDFLIDNR